MSPQERNYARVELVLAAARLKREMSAGTISRALLEDVALFCDAVIEQLAKEEDAEATQKKPYQTPKLISLGSVRELTQGSGSAGADQGGQQQP